MAPLEDRRQRPTSGATGGISRISGDYQASSSDFYSNDGDRSPYELARRRKATALRLLRERKPERRIDTNVEFHNVVVAP
jgi:hypothetical protein